MAGVIEPIGRCPRLKTKHPDDAGNVPVLDRHVKLTQLHSTPLHSTPRHRRKNSKFCRVIGDALDENRDRSDRFSHTVVAAVGGDVVVPRDEGGQQADEDA